VQNGKSLGGGRVTLSLDDTALAKRMTTRYRICLFLIVIGTPGCGGADKAMTPIKLEEFHEVDEGIGSAKFTGYRTPEGDIVKHGPYCWTAAGDLAREEGECQHGWRDGTWREYHDNGKLACVSEYREGEQHGRQTRWYEDGTLESEVNFEDNHPHGLARYYHPNGVLREETEYEYDFRNGRCTVWDESGTIIASGTYKDDQPVDGTFVVYEEIEPSPDLPMFEDYMDAVINRRSAVVTYRNGQFVSGKSSN